MRYGFGVPCRGKGSNSMKEDVQHDDGKYMSGAEYLGFAFMALALTVPVLIGHSPPGFLLFPAVIIVLATYARIRDARIQRWKEENEVRVIHWTMCSRTSGCVLEDRHGGECKLAKGF